MEISAKQTEIPSSLRQLLVTAQPRFGLHSHYDGSSHGGLLGTVHYSLYPPILVQHSREFLNRIFTENPSESVKAILNCTKAKMDHSILISGF